MKECDVDGIKHSPNKNGERAFTVFGRTEFSDYEKDAAAGRRAIGKKCVELYIGTACRDVVEQLRPGMRIAVFYGQPRMSNGKPFAPVEKIEILTK